MTRWRLLPFALLLAALLGIVALAAHGRPLGGSGTATGPSSTFLGYVYTSVVLVVIGSGLVVLWLFLKDRPPLPAGGPRRRHPLVTILFITVCGLILWGLASNRFERRFREIERRLHLAARSNPRQSGAHHRGGKVPKGGHAAQLQWAEVAVVLALLGALGVGAFVAGRRRPPPVSWQLASQAAVSAALDESLDDLRSEPDLRKAIIAAYARMERALAIAGIGRRPSEAPLEYLERALGQLETSAGAIQRLTHLFQWAKFSQHEPDPAMRDQAIDALVAVRDELRAPATEPVAA